MKIAGVIAEYNPFHSGHAYHLKMTRQQTGCDYVVVCMDGSYTQRGTAACLSKWDRARMALNCGADAVFELPALFAVRTADVFALGGVGVLGGIGVDVLSFGSEVDDADLLARLADLRDHEPEEVRSAIRKNLDLGMSHARAWGAAAAEHLNLPPELLNSPNLTLGTEYIRAIRRLDLSMQINPVARLGQYHDTSLNAEGFASATAIRAAMAENRMDDALAGIPSAVRDILAGAGSMHAPDDLLLSRLRTMFGADARSLTQKEKNAMGRWLDSFGYGEEIIARAYELTVNAISKPSIPYADSILTRWHSQGITTLEEIDADVRARGEAQSGTPSSFDTDEYFEDALKRSYS